MRLVAAGLVVVAGLAGCSVDPALRAARAELPASLASGAWPTLLPLGAFARTTPAPLPADTASLVARAASLRARSAEAFGKPVITPARRAALRAALAREGY